MDDFVKNAAIPVIIIIKPDMINEVLRPMLSAIDPIPISPSIDGSRAIA